MLKREKNKRLSEQRNKCLFCHRDFDLSHETPCHHPKSDTLICRSCLMFVNTHDKLAEKIGIDLLDRLIIFQTSHWVCQSGGSRVWTNETDQAQPTQPVQPVQPALTSEQEAERLVQFEANKKRIMEKYGTGPEHPTQSDQSDQSGGGI